MAFQGFASCELMSVLTLRKGLQRSRQVAYPRKDTELRVLGIYPVYVESQADPYAHELVEESSPVDST